MLVSIGVTYQPMILSQHMWNSVSSDTIQRPSKNVNVPFLLGPKGKD